MRSQVYSAWSSIEEEIDESKGDDGGVTKFSVIVIAILELSYLLDDENNIRVYY